MDPSTPDNADRTDRQHSTRSGRDQEAGGQPKDHTPTEGEYGDILQDLEALHGTICRTVDTVEKMPHTRPCTKFWDQIWLTFHMAGATTEDVWAIVRHTWHTWLKMLQETGRLGPGEWEELQEFVKLARDTVNKCNRIIAAWDVRREREYCQSLYRGLREFPIAKRKRLDASWQAMDRVVTTPTYRSLIPGSAWIFKPVALPYETTFDLLRSFKLPTYAPDDALSVRWSRPQAA